MSCVFCDRAWSKAEAEDVGRILDDAPMSELSGMRAVLGGGEPTLHPKLPTILAGLRERGARRLSIRTNGAWASRPEPVAILRKNGLTEVSLLFPSHDPATFDRLVRKADAFDTVMKGVANLAAAGVGIVVRVPLIRPTLPTIQDTLQAIPKLVGKVRRIDLVHLDIADPALQVSWKEIDEALPFGSLHPWPDVPPIHLDPGPGVPMCHTERWRQWRMTPDLPTAKGTFPKTCRTCFVRGTCPGVMQGYVKVFGEDVVTPFEVDFEHGLDKPRRERPARLADTPLEPVKGVTYECAESAGDESTLASTRLRVGHACNRRCDFCFIPHHEKSVQDYDIPAAIEAAVDAGVRELVMTGGEPTLQASLPGYIQKAQELGVRRIVLQTNGIRLADPDFAKQLIDAGLTSVVISLHAHRDDVLREITTLPGTMSRILAGIANLHEAGLQTNVTHVIGPKNYRHMPEFVKFMAEESTIRRFCFIFATPMAWPMAKKEIVVRYSDAAPYLMRALDYCVDNGIIVDGPSLKCGAPHCVLNGEPRYLLDAVPIPDENRTPDWIQVPACQRCTLKSQCYGVRRLYAWMYGIDEFKPVLEPGKLAADWNTGRHMPRLPSDAPVRRDVRADPVADTLRRLSSVGRKLGLGGDHVDRLLASHETAAFTVAGADGVAHPAFRVRYRGPDVDTMGPLELSPAASEPESRRMALLRRIRSAALGVSLGGAHGAIRVDPALPDVVLQDVLRQYAGAIASRTTPGRDYVTPHVSVPWERVEAAIAAVDTGTLGVLRGAQAGPLADLQMSSVDSAVAVATCALLRVRDLGGSRTVRYGVWGYGRAGRRFARLFDGVTVETDALRRPLLVACSDSRDSVIDQRGLEFERIAGFKVRNGKLPRPVHTVTTPEDLLVEPMELLLLAGRGPAFDAALAERVQARVVVDMTGELGADAEAVLRRRGILFLPALLATAGPVILADLERLGLLVGSAAELRVALARRMAALVERTCALAEELDLPMSEAILAAGLLAMGDLAAR